MAEETVSAPVANRYDRMEIAGAFGDLGALVPRGLLSNGQDDSYFTQTIMGTARRPGHSNNPLKESVRVAL